MRTMFAKYAGRCRGCGESIAVGDQILWSRREGAHHDNGVCYRDTGIGARYRSDAETEMDWEGEMIAREEREYQQGYHEVAAIHAMSAAGSDLREQMYLEMEQRDYNLYG